MIYDLFICFFSPTTVNGINDTAFIFQTSGTIGIPKGNSISFIQSPIFGLMKFNVVGLNTKFDIFVAKKNEHLIKIRLISVKIFGLPMESEFNQRKTESK